MKDVWGGFITGSHVMPGLDLLLGGKFPRLEEEICLPGY